jgi:hypothetical protein
MSTNQRILPAAVFVLLLATFLRFHLLEAQSFWNDEGNSARLSERSVAAIVEGTASDIHPPLYYLLLRGWRELAGETEFGLRSFSAFAGIMTVAVTMGLARRIISTQRRQGAKDAKVFFSSLASLRLSAFALISSAAVIPIAGLLAAVSPVLVYYSQETRMYALLGLLAALSAWALLNWLAGRGVLRSLGWAGAYTALLAAGLYTHYFFPAAIAAQGLIVVLWWVAPHWVTFGAAVGERRARFHRLLAWVGMVAVAMALYAPWTPIFLRQIGGRPGAPAGLASFLTESGRWLFLGSTIGPDELTWAVIAAVALAILGAAIGRRRSAVPLLLAAVPIALMFLAGATDPAFFKFLLVGAPFLAILMGLAWRWRGVWAVAPAALTVAVLAGSLLSLGNMYTDPAFARADYRGLAARIAAEGQSNAAIILDAPNQWEVFTYYHRDGAPVYPLPLGRPDPAILVPELERIAAAHDRLYVFYWGDAQRDPEHVVERWLDAHTFKASEEWIGDVRFVIYATTRETAAQPTASGAPFGGLDGETITLQEYTVWPTAAQAGDILQVRLVWSADAPTARPYKVFLHLLDGAGTPIAQRDGEPVGGSRPTTTWRPGEVIVDNHGIVLPPGIPPGEYALRLGLYDAFDPGARLPVNGEDSLLLATITVQGDE